MQNYQSDSVLIIKICYAVIKSFPCNGRACKHCYMVVFPSPTLKDCHFPTIHIFTPIEDPDLEDLPYAKMHK